MEEYGRFYEESLYPLQDGVLRIMAPFHTRFYLTGGTALGRGRYGHRYSDDLDFFANASATYAQDVLECLRAIRAVGGAEGIEISEAEGIFGSDYSRVIAKRGSVALKLDFINDIAFRVGLPEPSALFPSLDNVDNILANKLTALYRYAEKDIADIWAICRNHAFSWSQAFSDARAKEAGVDAYAAAEIIGSFPADRFELIKWRSPPKAEAFMEDLRLIQREILACGENSLSK